MVRIERFEHCGSYPDSAKGSDTWIDTWRVPTVTNNSHAFTLNDDYLVVLLKIHN